MKKAFALLLTFAMLLSLAACGSPSAAPSSSIAAPDAPSESAAVESAPADSSGKPDGYPVNPITLMVAWTAGGGSDLLSRSLAADSKEFIGVNMNVTNREGAGGTIGFAEAVDYANDGYNLIFSTSGVFSAQPLLREVEYSIDDFDFICGLSFEPLCIVVPASMGVSTIEELLEKLKSDGTELVVGTSGSAGSIPAYGAIELFPQFGVSHTIVNYTGAGEVIPALLSGEINCGYFHPHEAWPYVQSGDFAILGAATEERIENFPDIPTLREQGYDHINSVTKGIIAPAGLDPAIRDYLEASIMDIVNNGPNFKTYVESSGMQVQLSTGAQFKQAVLDQTESFKAIVG